MMSRTTPLNGRGSGVAAKGNGPEGRSANGNGGATPVPPKPAAKKHWDASPHYRLTAHGTEEETAARQAELFYLQKQIQSQTPMVIVLEDGEKIEGCIEWYDRQSMKVRGHAKTLIYKSAIKYMYKLGEAD
jgi:sRNA-binding regulator protein Hfq